MSVSTVSLRHLVLGLVAQQPMSGYDIKRFLQGLSWLISSPSSGSLYPILRALLQEGLVTVQVVPGFDRPPKKIYSITETGRRTLRIWVDQSAASNDPLKTFVMRLLLADSPSPLKLIATLRQRRTQVATQHVNLEQAVRTPDAELDLGQRLALDYGLALAAAELDWLDAALEQLLERAQPGEDA